MNSHYQKYLYLILALIVGKNTLFGQLYPFDGGQGLPIGDERSRQRAGGSIPFALALS
ncbi:MAG: hypothetical protein HWQ38_34005 [Nostoc sp. NMS7]|uniref:hypothetical protein n=1 Tax=Nostoc sp. NMS7 TaxID=2815391 RepID=UPI0025FF393C|nr:hypothetical protein [Nostoc sp. NMS7]MBN3951217.1 hypothetical protein [Nostoc sp. NMS7]